MQEDREKKRLEQLEHKKELAQLAEEEMDSIKANKPAAAQKMSRAQIAAQQEQMKQEAKAGHIFSSFTFTCFLVWLYYRGMLVLSSNCLPPSIIMLNLYFKGSPLQV